MSIQTIGKISLTAISQMRKTYPGAAAVAVEAGAVMGEIKAAQSAAQGLEGHVRIPYYGDIPINTSAIEFTASALGFIGGMAGIAVAVGAMPAIAGVSLLAGGAAVVAMFANPHTAAGIFDYYEAAKNYNVQDAFDAAGIPFYDPGEIVHSRGGFVIDQHGNARIDPAIGSDFTNAQRVTQRKDPLVLDLNGNGLESVGLSSSQPIYFDHDGDGIKTSTGWVAPSDGFLTLDRNGNGQIDDGSELFGDSTPLPDGSDSVDGFRALAQYDSNADGKIDHLDPVWNTLRVWKDLNQDAVSQAEELLSMSQAGVAEFYLNDEFVNQVLSNGNQIASVAKYTLADGTESTFGATAELADIDLIEDTFNSQFTDTLPITEAAYLLPQMAGSGMVRSLREAASQDTAEALQLRTLLEQIGSATSREAQVSLIDDLIIAWSKTSAMQTSIDINQTPSSYDPWVGNAAPPENYNPYSDVTAIELFATENPEAYARITALEKFNGRPILSNFVDIWSMSSSGATSWRVFLWTGRESLLGSAWDTLWQSVYSAVALQTRLSPLFMSLEIEVFSDGTSAIDAQAVKQHFTNRSLDEATFLDILDFAMATKALVPIEAWAGDEFINAALNTVAMSPSIMQRLEELKIPIPGDLSYKVQTSLAADNSTFGGTKADTIQGKLGSENLIGRDGNDILFGNAGDDRLDGGNGNDDLHGGVGNDRLIGDQGDDRLYGNEGNDSIDGGYGDDRLDGGSGDDIFVDEGGSDYFLGGDGADTYVLHAGSGRDVILNFETVEDVDILLFEGVTTSQVSGLRRVGDDLILDYGASDSVTISGFYNGSTWQINQFKFADPVTLSPAELLEKYPLALTDSSDLSTFTDAAEVVSTGEGSDKVYGGGGNDRILGEGGDDWLFGDGGDDTLTGDIGSDTLEGGSANDVLEGGIGTDTLIGGNGSDTYLLHVGSGNDLVENYSDNGSTETDTLFIDVDSTQLRSVRREGIDLILEYGESDQVRVKAHFNGAGWQLDQINFRDGVMLRVQEIAALPTTLTEQAENMTLSSDAELIYAAGGNDTIWAGIGDDQLHGELGDDWLLGQEGSDRLVGGTGNDKLQGGSGTDLLDGEIGADFLEGGEGADSYLLRVGSGADRIDNFDSDGSVDTVVFEDVGIASLRSVLRQGNDLVISYGQTDSLVIQSHFNTPLSAIDDFVFADGSKMTSAELLGRFGIHLTSGNDTVTQGSAHDQVFAYAGNDSVSGGDGNDAIYGGGGNDTVSGDAGNDNLFGEDGDDLLRGGTGGDQIDGGSGRDSIVGGDGADTYEFFVGAGIDSVDSYESVSSIDTIKFADVASTGLRAVRRIADDFIIDYGASDQITIKGHFNNVYWQIDQVSFSDGVTWTIDQLYANLPIYQTDAAESRTYGAVGETIYAAGGNDTVYGGVGNDSLYGELGNDNLNGEGWHDKLYGGAGDDFLNGGIDNDLLEGGVGNDYLVGGMGVDSFIFTVGAGIDTIDCYEGMSSIDTIKFSDVPSTGLRAVRRIGDDLILEYGTTDQVTVKSHFNNLYWQIDQISFSDGVTWTIDQLYANAPIYQTDAAESRTYGAVGETIYAAGGNDTIYGGVGNDSLYGELGNDNLNGEGWHDKLYGGAGDDTLNGGVDNDLLEGGVGNDFLIGGTGTDTFVFSVGSGSDTIDCYEGTSSIDTITFTDVSSAGLRAVRRIGDDLVLEYGAADQVTIKGHFNAVFWQVDQVAFSDGMTWTIDQLYTNLPIYQTDAAETRTYSAAGETIYAGGGSDTVYGGVGNDSLFGELGNDTLNGESGHDKLYGGAGDDSLNGGADNDQLDGGDGNDNLIGGAGLDIFVFSLGAGVDRIDCYEGTSSIDTIKFNDVSSTELRSARRVGNDLVLEYGATDQVTVTGHFNGVYYQADQFTFSDGVTWTPDQLLQSYSQPAQLTGVSPTNGDPSL